MSYLSYLSEIPFTIPEIVLISLAYLVIDLYPQVKSFRAMLTTGSFLLYWAAIATLTGIAYFFLATTSLAKVQGLVGPTGAKLTIIILAALMNAALLQSLSLRISEKKIVDLQALLDDYRRQVLEDITKRNSNMERGRAFHLADKLVAQFSRDELREEYSQLLLMMAPDSATQLAQSTTNDAARMTVSEAKLIALRIARMDSGRCRQLLDRSKPQ